ncbi:hypothetical protein [Enterococcus mundtii]|uniref:hypothetical protein n=1 Tax=Enterococcus mundtii TaxID=53346 RepID=UPI001A970F20|nr:hypothetical protein [Enterococcus mundtii]MBO1087254.1 hypothetical protein [Enterococcus mundtii]
MGIEITKVHMPVHFELVSGLEDSRFQKTKIWIAHTGENLNNTYFTKELLTEMANTLPYIPIVGFIEKNEDDQNDFSDHRSSLVIEKNKIKVEYQGKAYGFVSDEPNAQFEFRNGKEWLTCEGYLWTKFRQAIEIFEESSGIKNQSMEIQDVDGKVDDIGRMVFSKGKFSALCILGEHISPAMTGSTVEFFSTTKDSIKEMIHEFSLQKGDLSLKTTKKKVTDDTAVTDDEKAAKEKAEQEAKEKAEKEAQEQAEKEAAEKAAQEKAEKEAAAKEVEDKAAQEKAEQEAAEAAKANEEDDEETIEENLETEDHSAKEFSHIAQFELSHGDLRQQLSQLIRNLYFDEDVSVYVLEVFDNHMICELYDWKLDSQTYIDVAYERVEETVVLGDKHTIIPMFVSIEEKERIEADRKRLAELEKEIMELQQFKTKSENISKEAVLEEFQEVLTEVESAAIRENFSKMSVKEVEKEVAYTCFQKTKNTEEFSGARTVAFGAMQSSGKYGALDVFFKK